MTTHFYPQPMTISNASLQRICENALDLATAHTVKFHLGDMVVSVDNRQPAPDWPALMAAPAFRSYCEATVRTDEAEHKAERED